MANEILCDAKYLRLVRANGWEFVQRKNVSGIVGIIAVTSDRKLILVEQYRPPVGKNVIEIPAGLAGDSPTTRNEDLALAAMRELEEETGIAGVFLEQLYTFGDPERDPRGWVVLSSGKPSKRYCSVTNWLNSESGSLSQCGSAQNPLSRTRPR